MTAPALHLSDVTVRYGDILALDAVTFDLQSGQVCALVGMNGSGKSTLFKSVMGTTKLESGSVKIAGTTGAKARTAGLVGYVPQHESIDWQFPISVRDVVMTGRYGHLGFTRRPRQRDRAAVDDALARVGLSELRHRQIGQLSGGQRKRAFVARCLAQEATILLLDEPFAGVDQHTQASLIELIRNLAKAGASILVATHDLQTLTSLADETIVLKNRVLAHGPTPTIARPEILARVFGLDSASGDLT